MKTAGFPPVRSVASKLLTLFSGDKTMSERWIKVVFDDNTEQTYQLGKHDALSDWFRNRGIDLVASTTNVKQILFLGYGTRMQWEDITADWVE